MAVDGRPAPARLPEVDVARELADDQDVQAGDQFGFEAGRAYQLLITDRRPQVGEQAQVLAQAEHGLLRAQRPVELVVFPVAYRAEQHRVGVLGQLEGGFGQRMPMRLVGGAAHQRGFHLELQVQHLEDLHRFRDDFGADAVARQDCDFHGLSAWASHGFWARRCASKALILSAWRSVSPMSSRPLVRQNLRKAWTSKANLPPWGLTTTWRSRSMVSW